MSEKHGEIENECSSVAVGKKGTTTVGPQFCTASFSVGFKFSGPASVSMNLSISMVFWVKSRWFIVVPGLQFFGSYHFLAPQKPLSGSYSVVSICFLSHRAFLNLWLVVQFMALKLSFKTNIILWLYQFELPFLAHIFRFKSSVSHHHLSRCLALWIDSHHELLKLCSTFICIAFFTTQAAT